MNIHPGAGAFVIAAGAVLGICAGLLWTAQGSLMLAYPTEDQKGKFIGVFWAIFNLGAVVGASVSLGQNFHSKVCLYMNFHRVRGSSFFVRRILVSQGNSNEKYKHPIPVFLQLGMAHMYFFLSNIDRTSSFNKLETRLDSWS